MSKYPGLSNFPEGRVGEAILSYDIYQFLLIFKERIENFKNMYSDEEYQKLVAAVDRRIAGMKYYIANMTGYDDEDEAIESARLNHLIYNINNEAGSGFGKEYSSALYRYLGATISELHDL